MAAGGEHDLRLLRAYEPVLRFNRGELFLPVSVEAYLRDCSLWRQIPGARLRDRVAPAGELTPQRLAELGRQHRGEALSLRYVDRPLGRREVLTWRRDGARPRLRPSARFAAVGLLGRLIDAVVRLSLIFRGRVPGGTAAAAEVQCRTAVTGPGHPYYGRVTRDAGFVVLQYWFLYAMNDWRSSFAGVNDHEADWEQITLFLPEGADGSVPPSWVAFSSHEDVGQDLRRRHDDPDIGWVGHHPVVYVGAGSHSGAYLPGDYLVTVQPPGLQRFSDVVRRVRRVVLPWTVHRPPSPMGVPYVDYRRGDGVAIGPGSERHWVPVVIDDETSWARDYHGLWGLDTSDPLGGERAPAGPRYERNGTLRTSWSDPVGWAVLDHETATAEQQLAALQDRLPELVAEIETAEAEIDALRAQLRRAHAGARAVARVTGGRKSLPPSRELVAQRERLARLRKERDAVEEALRGPLSLEHPHAHLRHRTLPDIDPARTPSRLLHAWSMVSVSVLLLGLAVVVLSRSTTVWILALTGLIMGALLLEALARGRFIRVLLNIVAAVVTIAALVALGVAFVLNWHVGVAALLAAAAIALLIANFRDFLSKR